MENLAKLMPAEAMVRVAIVVTQDIVTPCQGHLDRGHDPRTEPHPLATDGPKVWEHSEVVRNRQCSCNWARVDTGSTPAERAWTRQQNYTRLSTVLWAIRTLHAVGAKGQPSEFLGKCRHWVMDAWHVGRPHGTADGDEELARMTCLDGQG